MFVTDVIHFPSVAIRFPSVALSVHVSVCVSAMDVSVCVSAMDVIHFPSVTLSGCVF